LAPLFADGSSFSEDLAARNAKWVFTGRNIDFWRLNGNPTLRRLPSFPASETAIRSSPHSAELTRHVAAVPNKQRAHTGCHPLDHSAAEIVPALDPLDRFVPTRQGS